MRRIILCVLFAFVLGGALAYAQTASIAGTILDATNAGVPGATVNAKNVATGVVRTTTTGANGTYSIPNLTVGSYDVSVQKQGFSILQFSSRRAHSGAEPHFERHAGARHRFANG